MTNGPTTPPTSSRVAAIDIGTNTVLLLVAERLPAGELSAVEELATITRLGEGVDKTRMLAPAAIERTIAAIDRYAEVIRRLGVKRLDVVGTSAMRDAGGSDVLREHIKKVLGVTPRTISGDEEARLTFGGALSGIAGTGGSAGSRSPGTQVRVFDIGGGSTEVVHGDRTFEPPQLLFAHSYDVGSVRLTERHVKSDPPTPSELAAVREDARAAFADVPKFESDIPPVAIAGTMTTIAAVSLKMSTYDGARVHGHRMAASEVERVVEELARLPLEQRRSVPGLEPKRADVIVAGGCIAIAYLAHVGAREVMISDGGVRWGLAEELATST